MKIDVTILGAGIMGCCVALELANRGYNVTLIEQDHIPFNRSSIRNEGKIHLGLVYMNDPSFETPFLMLKAALRFSKYLERWIGRSAYDLNISTPFWYLVSNDSFLNPGELEQGYDRLQTYYDGLKTTRGDSYNYLGTTPDRLARKCSKQDLERYFNTDSIMGGFKTNELAIDTSKLADHIRKAIQDHANIHFLGGRKVECVTLKNNRYKIEGSSNQGSWIMEAPQVVNATWMGKYKIDQSFGIPVPSNILFRLKYRVIAEIPEEMASKPSVTMVIGRFGDVVIRPDKTAYVSWYPDACRGWSIGVEPPDSWDNACKGIVPIYETEKLSALFIAATKIWYPDVETFNPKIVDAGIIVAKGQTDVDDENSQLHKRVEVGVTSYGGYHTIETGKLTTAPLFAMETAENVERNFRNL